MLLFVCEELNKEYNKSNLLCEATSCLMLLENVNGFSDIGPRIRFLRYQKRPFLTRHFLIKLSDSPILLENPDFRTGWGFQKMLLEKDFNSYRMTVSQP